MPFSQYFLYAILIEYSILAELQVMMYLIGIVLEPTPVISQEQALCKITAP